MGKLFAMNNLKIKTPDEESFFIEEIEKIARNAGELSKRTTLKVWHTN